MISVNKIREVVLQYLASPSDANQFASAFSEMSSNIHKHGDPAAVKLADQVESCLADVRAGFASIPDLHKSLRELLAPARVGYYYVAAAGFSQSVNHLAVIEKDFPSLPVSGTSPSVVFGSEVRIRA